MTTLKTIYEYLLTYEYFSADELDLVRMAWGDNEQTYNKICRVRYELDVDQLAKEDKVQIEELY